MCYAVYASRNSEKTGSALRKNIAVILASIILLMTAYAAYEMLVPVSYDRNNYEVEIPRGATFRQAAGILFKQKLIKGGIDNNDETRP